ncbi:PucR family transcriptional regulator [Cryptosporangium sp. NPDC048952]|uniref:PucR family transcriptional regulator n=1 Tax=Cryptosporangium sp. NPDC048952 TaxID=3363961 RepID=UPI0037228CA2
MAAEQVQDIVDALASALRRAVAVDDHTLRLIAVSEDFGDSDPPRIWSLLHRRTRPEDVQFDRFATAEEPVRIPANPELELAPRLVIPLRHEGLLVGYMWLIERHSAVDEPALRACLAAGGRIAELLHERLVVGGRDRELAGRLVDEVTSGDAAAVARAASDLRSKSLLADEMPLGVLVLRPAAGRIVRDADVHRFAGTYPARTMLVLCAPQEAVVLVSRPALTVDALTELAGELRRAQYVVGVSDVVSGLTNAAQARRKATVAADVAALLPQFDGIVSWNRVGPYAFLRQIPRGALEMLPAGLAALFEPGANEQLLATAETYLDCGGDKQKTARLLHIHRATLYYRLERIEALTGLSLADGTDRLLVHMAIKLRRLH